MDWIFVPEFDPHWTASNTQPQTQTPGPTRSDKHGPGWASAKFCTPPTTPCAFPVLGSRGEYPVVWPENGTIRGAGRRRHVACHPTATSSPDKACGFPHRTLWLQVNSDPHEEGAETGQVSDQMGQSCQTVLGNDCPQLVQYLSAAARRWVPSQNPSDVSQRSLRSRSWKSADRYGPIIADCTPFPPSPCWLPPTRPLSLTCPWQVIDRPGNPLGSHP